MFSRLRCRSIFPNSLDRSMGVSGMGTTRRLPALAPLLTRSSLPISSFSSSSSSSSLPSSSKKWSEKSIPTEKADILAQHLKRMKIKSLADYVPGIRPITETGGSAVVPTAITAMGRKRGGRKFVKQAAKRKEEEAKLRPFMHQTGGGHFPSQRYSPEETLRLLEEAYSSIPPRAGPRRTRRAKRQRAKNRLRSANAQKRKIGRIVGHERRMERRIRRRSECLELKKVAPETVVSEAEYRKRVLAAFVDRGLTKERGGYGRWTVLEKM